MPESVIVTVELTPAQVKARVAGDEVSGQVALDRMAASKAFDDACRAVLSAEAGDQGTWMGGGLEITYPSAEAGATE